jgi:Tol biopolymer transport system component
MAELFISSTWRDDKPRYSPDGKNIAFTSSRSGFSEIWVSKADGSNPVRMTFFGGPLIGHANWSPDGQWLVFHARPEGQADVFVMPAAGGPAKRLTTNLADDTLPSYSHDGRWIYFSSARSGQDQIWRMPAAGGKAVQLTTSGGSAPIESPDGKAVFYRVPDENGRGIWRMPSGGGKSVKVAGPTHDFPSGFAVTADGLYFPAPPHFGDQRFIRFFSFSTGQSRPVAVASHAFHLGMSVSPDSKYVLFDQVDEAGSDLMLIENFRPQ